MTDVFGKHTVKAVGNQDAGSLSNQQLRNYAKAISIGVMVPVLLAALAYVWAYLIGRHRLAMGAAALRQQFAVCNANWRS